MLCSLVFVQSLRPCEVQYSTRMYETGAHHPLLVQVSGYSLRPGDTISAGTPMSSKRATNTEAWLCIMVRQNRSKVLKLLCSDGVLVGFLDEGLLWTPCCERD